MVKVEKLALSLKEMTAAGGGSHSTLYLAIKSGKLRARKRGRSTIILVPDAVRYLEALPDFHDDEAA
jgi:hypothetical protein